MLMLHGKALGSCRFFAFFFSGRIEVEEYIREPVRSEPGYLISFALKSANAKTIGVVLLTKKCAGSLSPVPRIHNKLLVF